MDVWYALLEGNEGTIPSSVRGWCNDKEQYHVQGTKQYDIGFCQAGI